MARKTRERSATQTGNGGSRTGTETKPSKPAQQHSGSIPLNPEKLKRLYSTMLKCRMIDERICGLFKQGKFTGNYCAAIGQEATDVGAAIDLLSEDCIAFSDRDSISSFIKGTPPRLIFARLYARHSSLDQGSFTPARDGRTPLKIVKPAASIAAQINIATGVALACKMKKRPFVTLAFCGDGSTLGLWHEAMNLAGKRKLPIVFMIENNSWAEPASIGGIAVQDLSVKARAYGFPGITVDGNDVVAVFRVAQEAIRRAREGHGSALIECKTYRWPGHSEIAPAEDLSAEQAENWKLKDPILFMENYLKRKNLWSDEWKQSVVDEFSKELAEAVALAEQSTHREPVRCREQVRSFEILEGELNRKPLTFRRTISSPAKLGKS